jgi:hypothetical protein
MRIDRLRASRNNVVHYKAQVIAPARSFLALGVILFAINAIAQVTLDGQRLKEFISTKTRQNPVLSYEQSYFDDDHARVLHRGTFYTAIQQFEINECTLKARVAAEHKFSGAIARNGILGRAHVETIPEFSEISLQDYRVNLSEVDADEVHELQAIPGEIGPHRGIHCEGEPLCNLSWVQLIAPRGSFSVSRVVNGFARSDTNVQALVLPVSSSEAARTTVSLLQNAIRQCGNARPAVTPSLP